MKRLIKSTAVLAIMVIVIAMLPLTASANSAEPPILRVMVMFAPDDLQLRLITEDGTVREPIVKKNRGYDTFYNFWYWWPEYSYEESEPIYEYMTLIVATGGETYEIQLPERGSYHGLYTLDLEERTLTLGTPPARDSVLVAMRVVLTLLIEGLIFLAFRFKGWRNWLVFFGVNIVTQGGLNLIFLSPDIGSNGIWAMGLLLLEGVIFMVEAVAFAMLLRKTPKELQAAQANNRTNRYTGKDSWKPIVYAIVANIASFILGMFLIIAFMVQY